MEKNHRPSASHHLAVFRLHGINRPFKPDKPDATASGDNGASPSFATAFVINVPLRRAGLPTSGEAGYSIPAGRGAASYCACACLCARECEWGACIVSAVASPASSSSGRGVKGRSCSPPPLACFGAAGCGLLREPENMSMYGICTGIASGSWRSACSGLRRSARRCSAVLCPDEGGEFPGDLGRSIRC